MAITISGVNNNDKILASDGVIDQLSGFSVVGVMTAASFSGNLIGDVTGNLTGNVNASSNLLLQIGGSEKFRVASSGQLGIGGANYGSSGQVLTSGGSGSAASWTTITQGFSPDAQNNLVAGTNAGDSFSGTDANHNLLLGFDAGTNITSGDDNICLGRDAGKATTVYSDNVYIGPECGKQNNAANNVCIGNFAGGKLTGAADNVYIGYQTGEGLFSGTRTGSKNVALGKYALAEITTGHRNVVLGDTAANKLQNGSDNVIIGTQAATTGTNDLVNGSNNIILGHDAVASSSSVSNEITLGDTAITKFRIPGINFILKDNGGTPTQGHVLTVDANGEASFAASSGTTINSNADNRIITGSGTANTLEAESNLTFNSSSLNVGAGVTIETNGQATYAGIVTASSFKLSDGSSVGGAVSSDSEFNVVVGTNAGGGLVSGGEKNVMVGHNAGLGMTTSDRSVVIGYEAAKNTYRGGLVAIGYQALMYGTNPTGSKGDSHTAIGNECMKNLGYYVNYNTAVGSNAMKNATSGFNSAFGVGALQSGSGEINTAIGMNSLDVCNGSWNSALGYKSGDDCTSGSKNSLIGVYAGEDIGSGSHNLCLGAYSTVSASGVSNECVIGAPSGHASVINHVRMPGIGVSFSAGGGVVTGIMTASSFKFLDGSTVGGVTSDAQGNTVGGSGAGDSFTGTDAENNTLFGKDAGTAITSADSTTAVGKDAGKSITTGSYNHLFGIGAGDAITTGTNNTIMGHHAGSSFSTASSNTIVGGNAGGGSSLGSNNVIIGKSCNQNNEGQRNVFIGQGAVAYRSGTATDNVIIGQAAAEFLTNGNHNAGVGKDVFDDISTGSDNSALGSNAGDTLTTGSNNLFLGHDAFPSSATVSNEITLGDTNITKFRIPGLSYTIDDGGRVLVNGTSSTSPDGFNHLIQVNSGSHEGGITIGRHTANANGPALIFQKSRSGSATPGNGVLSNNDTLGVIRFYGSDGTDRNSFAANIGCEVDGSPGGNDMPGRLIFSTTADGAATSTERLRITSSGKVGINEDNPQTTLNVRGCISTGRNVARELGTIIDISSNYSGGRNGASVINGQKNYEENTNADWITANGQRVNANLTIDLGAQYTCDRFVIYNQNEYTNNVREVKRFTLEGSNDKSSWTTLLDDECGASYAHEPNPGFSFRIPSDFTDDDEGATYRYWRFTMKNFHGSTTLGGVMELELYEIDSNNKTISEISTHHLSAQDISAQNIYHDLPAFFACKTSSLSISNQTNTVLAFTTDQGPGFDTTNGDYQNNNYRFNPKIPGYYQINMCCSVSYGALQAGQIYIYKNGSAYAFSQLYLNGGDSYDDICLTISTLVHLDGQSDYLEARAWRNGGNGGLGSGFQDQQWSGYLVRHAGYRRHGDGV